jgi:hypothetical protein
MRQEKPAGKAAGFHQAMPLSVADDAAIAMPTRAAPCPVAIGANHDGRADNDTRTPITAAPAATPATAPTAMPTTAPTTATPATDIRGIRLLLDLQRSIHHRRRFDGHRSDSGESQRASHDDIADFRHLRSSQVFPGFAPQGVPCARRLIDILYSLEKPHRTGYWQRKKRHDSVKRVFRLQNHYISAKWRHLDCKLDLTKHDDLRANAGRAKKIQRLCLSGPEPFRALRRAGDKSVMVLQKPC